MDVTVTKTSSIAYDTWATVVDSDLVSLEASGTLSDYRTTPLPVNVNFLYPPADVFVGINETDKTLFKTKTYFRLRWTKNPLNKNLNVVKYRIYIKYPDENVYTYLDEVLSEDSITDSNDYAYEGTFLKSSERIIYVVTALDSSGRESGFSEAAGELSKGK
jgi:hypothetical protein